MKVNDVKNSQTQLVIPPSIKSKMDMLGETDPAEMNIQLIQHSAETVDSLREGMISGLDADEIALLSKLSPELKEQYETMANSDINKENLQNDICKAKEQLDDAISTLEKRL